MYTGTIQSSVIHKATRSVLKAKRQLQRYKPALTVSVDEPMELRTLGKDLVGQYIGATIATKEVDGRYVDLVGPDFEKIRVFTRVLRRVEQGYAANVSSDEISAISYAKDKDRPHDIYFVVFNPLTEAVDIFRFPVKTEGLKRSYGVRYSPRTRSYVSKETYKVASLVPN
jgi:hypothetical protein